MCQFLCLQSVVFRFQLSLQGPNDFHRASRLCLSLISLYFRSMYFLFERSALHWIMFFQRSSNKNFQRFGFLFFTLRCSRTILLCLGQGRSQ